MGLEIRWMVRSDWCEVLDIEQRVAREPLSEQDVAAVLALRNMISLVCTNDVQVVGYMVYAMFPKEIGIIRLAVHPAYHRKGVATALVRSLKKKLKRNRRKLVADVPERELALQLLFKSTGFKAVRVTFSEFYGQDTYMFEYEPDAAERDRNRINNRVAKYYAK